MITCYEDEMILVYAGIYLLIRSGWNNVSDAGAAAIADSLTWNENILTLVLGEDDPII
jgi:hypothetical protein